jgi:hypothetical protein
MITSSGRFCFSIGVIGSCGERLGQAALHGIEIGHMVTKATHVCTYTFLFLAILIFSLFNKNRSLAITCIS